MIFIFSQNYPSENNNYAMSYVHSRNLFYLEKGLDFKVVSFSTKGNYIYESVQVITQESFKKEVENLKEFMVISHAPNLKNHLKLINRYSNKIYNLIFIFHGHEVLKVNRIYPVPYNFKKISRSKRLFRGIYDEVKLSVLKIFIKNFSEKIDLIFVSEWMLNEALNSLKLKKEQIKNLYIINNNANEVFLNKSYEYMPVKKKGDFITIRPLDDSKYAIDLICKLALNHKGLSFHIYGKGEYFEHFEKPNNVEVFSEFIEQRDIPKLLNCYRAALMPTRLDAQGVMMCEMATYGIPLVTTNLDICKEMLAEFENVHMFDETSFKDGDLNNVLKKRGYLERNEIFSSRNTTEKEIEIIKGRIKDE